MKKKVDSKVEYARLPDGQKVVVQSRAGEIATVRRVNGPRSGTVAVCAVGKLRRV